MVGHPNAHGGVFLTKKLSTCDGVAILVPNPFSQPELEDGDIEEALNAAAKIGDDYLQKQAYGRTMPETFNHGTSAQRSRWLKKGLTTGDVSQGDTFSPAYSSL